MRIPGDVPSLAAFEIREEDKAARVEALEEDGAQERLAISIYCRKTHRVWFDDLFTNGVAKPRFELSDRIAEQISVPQFLPGIV